MPVSISMNVVQNSVDNTNNRSLVTVTVTAHYTGGSFNRNDPPLTVTLDGVSETVNVDFNASNNTSGSETIYSRQWYVGHNSDGTKTLYYSASYVTGVSSGTVSTSGSLVLSSTGGSSGGSSSGGDPGGGDSGGGTTGGGGDSGDDSGDDSGGGDYGGDSGGGDPGGDVGNPENVLAAEPGNATVINNIFFGYDTTLSPDNYHTIGGQVVAESGNNRIGIIRFETPNFEGASTSVDLRFSVGNVYGNSQTVNFAICTADAYAFSYIVYPDSISDPYAIASGTIQLTANSICSVTVPTSALKGNTTYYVFLWFPYTTSNFVYADINKTEWHGIDVNYKKDFVYIDSGSGFGTYQCFIDNGTSWDLVKAFIDNGSEFVPYS